MSLAAGPASSGREKSTRRARLDSFLQGPIDEYLKGHGFTKARRTFRHVARNNDILAFSFGLDTAGRDLEGELVFLIEAAVFPPLFYKFTCDHVKITPPQKPGTMYGMWRSWVTPNEISRDADRAPLFPTQAWRFSTYASTDEGVASIGGLPIGCRFPAACLVRRGARAVRRCPKRSPCCRVSGRRCGWVVPSRCPGR